MQELLAVLPPFKPLLNIFTGLAAGLFFASFLEALNLTKYVAKFMRPFVRSAHLCDISAASFALALFSPASANAMLGEALQNKKLSEKEVIISNLFNSLPSTLTHIPTFFFMSFPIIGKAAVIYTAISFISALIRTAATLSFAGFLLRRSERKKRRGAGKNDLAASAFACFQTVRSTLAAFFVYRYSRVFFDVLSAIFRLFQTC